MSSEESIPSVEIPDDYKDMMSGVDDFIGMARDSGLLTCDETCQKNKDEEKFYNNFLIQKANLLNATKQFEIAEREYITSSEGVDYYKSFKEEEYKEDVEEIVEGLNKKFLNLFISIDDKIENNCILNNAIKNTKELRKTYSEKISNLKTEISNEDNTGNVANRKSYYKNKKIYSWCSLNKNLFIFFWILFIAYVIIAVRYKQYTKKHVKIALFVIPLLALLNPNTIYSIIHAILYNNDKIYHTVASFI